MRLVLVYSESRRKRDRVYPTDTFSTNGRTLLHDLRMSAPLEDLEIVYVNRSARNTCKAKDR